MKRGTPHAAAFPSPNVGEVRRGGDERWGRGGGSTMNTPQRLVHVPPGVQCFVGDEARGRRRIEESVVQVFEGWDYEEIIPPLYDYAEVFAGPALSPKTYSFVGRDGSVLALRPDFTSLLAKVAAGRPRDRPPPLPPYPSGGGPRHRPPQRGRPAGGPPTGPGRPGGGR